MPSAAYGAPVPPTAYGAPVPPVPRVLNFLIIQLECNA